ncbi:hypothetical protein CABS01_11586 [Colletotrichum abscissum]|uniref:uncharacterized protein n=1 Tax=Colletotrichum abscissum TaxID=1671311 RepID=UPI0027D6AC3C|nr:uncharacterized protein CABS01_11586 [Colletotrichum abscissum]KAK1493417.1 hypothetical protein CABS01_11586 [Colletotrichum abscissum]
MERYVVRHGVLLLPCLLFCKKTSYPRCTILCTQTQTPDTCGCCRRGGMPRTVAGWQHHGQ